MLVRASPRPFAGIKSGRHERRDADWPLRMLLFLLLGLKLFDKISPTDGPTLNWREHETLCLLCERPIRVSASNVMSAVKLCAFLLARFVCWPESSARAYL